MVNRNYYLIPTNPSGIIAKYPVWYNLSSLSLSSLNKTWTLLSDIYRLSPNIHCQPVKQIVNYQQQTIGIMTHAGSMIPIKEQAPSDKYPIYHSQYYLIVDRHLLGYHDQIDNRVRHMNRLHFEEEMYQRLRFEISQFLPSSHLAFNSRWASMVRFRI